MKKIYLAGPDVFEPDAAAIGQMYKQQCLQHGFTGLYPLDNEIKSTDDKKQMAQAIFKANIKLIDKADIVIANLNPFRGKEPDSGTVWECGYAFAIGKKVYGYKKDLKPYIDTFDKKEKTEKDSLTYDGNGTIIEDFDYPANLMIACTTQIFDGELEDVLKAIKI